MLILEDTPLINMLIESLHNTCYTTLYAEYKTDISHAYNSTTLTYNLLKNEVCPHISSYGY